MKLQLQLIAKPERVEVPGTLASPPVPARHHPGAQKLWLCIHFPELSLDALGSPTTSPSVVLAEEKGIVTVRASNARALSAGVIPGMALNAALALCPDIDIRQRRESAEQAMLRARANWALAYTPVVSIEPGGALLLEVGGSLRLFGGFNALHKRLVAELERSGGRVVITSAPFAKAALWLARANRNVHCTAPQSLAGTLADLPLVCLGWPVRLQQRLLQMGVRTLGECIRLPRDGFARRIGRGYLQEIDQALGRCPEILRRYELPPVFSESLELAAESLAVDELTLALQELLKSFSVRLDSHQAGAQCLRVRLRHLRHQPTLLEVSLREPSASVDYFMELLGLQLDRQVLPAPVVAISLHAILLPDFQPPAGDLLHGTFAAMKNGMAQDALVQSSHAARFIERLRARVGAHRVYGLNMVAEHRPEYAWQAAEPGGEHGGSDVPGVMASRVRPLWLLRQPRQLETHCDRPVYGGDLVFRSAAERIESGWWDGRDIRRDYYKVTDRRGRCFWVYRDCRNRGWFLHGLFA